MSLCILLAALPAAAEIAPDSFEPVYSARITRKSSLRGAESKNGKLVATLYPNDVVELGEIGEEWTPARKGSKIGYVLTASLKDLNVLSPYRALPEGETRYPYAAMALEPAVIDGTVYGQTGELQTIPAGAVVAAG